MNRVTAAALVLLGSAFPPASAAIIGPTVDWKGLRAGAVEWGISEETVNDIVRAGITVTCPGDTYSNGSTQSAWLLGESGTSLTTIANVFYDESGRPRAPLEECAVRPLAEWMNRREFEYPRPVTTVDAGSIRVGTTDPHHDDVRKSRATAELASALGMTRPLPLPDAPAKVKVGDEVFIVSYRFGWLRANNNGTEPVIMRATVKAVTAPSEGQPGYFKSDADIVNEWGALYLVRQKGDPERLVPIALEAAPLAIEVYGDGIDRLPFDADRNSGVGVMLGEAFYQFEDSAD